MGRLKKIAYPAGNNEFIHVPKRVIDNLNKKTIITNQYTVGGTGGKLIIEYQAKRGSNRGVIELNDMGPDELKEEN